MDPPPPTPPAKLSAGIPADHDTAGSGRVGRVSSEDPFELTERERRVISVLASVWVVVGFVTIISVNVSGEWWPAIVELALLALLVVGTTVWIARSRRQRPWPTFLRIVRRGERA